MDQVINAAEDGQPAENVAADTDPSLDVSGFYGPGSIACWYLLVSSVIVTWLWKPRYRFKVTNDFIAAVAYPLIANGHLLLQIIQFPPDKKKDLVDGLKLTFQNNYYGPPQHDSADQEASLSAPEAEEVYSQVVTISVAMWMTGHFAYLCIVGLALAYWFHRFSGHKWRQTRASCLVLSAGLLWSWAVTLTFLVKASSIHAFEILLAGILYRVCCAGWAIPWAVLMFLLGNPLLQLILAVASLLCRHSIKETFVILFSPTAKDVPKESPGLIWWFMTRSPYAFGFLGFVILLSWLTWVGFSPGMFFPDTGIPLSELDQAAALLGGVLTLASTVYSVLKDPGALSQEYENLLSHFA